MNITKIYRMDIASLSNGYCKFIEWKLLRICTVTLKLILQHVCQIYCKKLNIFGFYFQYKEHVEHILVSSNIATFTIGARRS